MKHLILLFFIFLLNQADAQSEKKATVYFGFNSAELSQDQQMALAEVKSSLQSGRFDLVSVEGFTDTLGSKSYNNDLARKRSQNVLSYLELGNTTVVPTSFGENYSVSSSYTHENHRRVDVHYRMNNVVPSDETLEPKAPTIVDKFTNFLNDSVSLETMIELSILFVPGKALVLPESTHELLDLYDFMRDNLNVHAFIRGHVCCSDDMSLSIERAATVYNYLKDRTISPSRLKFEGYSNSIPAVSPEITEEDQKRNRRVDIIFTKVK
jgi:outer membrane protein OmpA-like peptidoglycan-associated protein